MDKMVTLRPGYVAQLYSRYDWPGLSSVGKLETIREDLTRFLDTINCAFDKSRILEAPALHKSREVGLVWDQELRKKVAELDKLAFVKYGYDLGV
ncbi:hypothetical protein [Thiohalocapsa halophila]|uniref:hypothetical protein n=1 Tax=Thiohalocapsa halophila TaxID=69359 RepID=UPI0019056818|nr:hypothetical protein [Thiohalocapsa halophila]